MKNPTYHKIFMPMCPSYAFIDRADGRVNRAMDFKKDYSGLISAAWDIDNAYDRYLNNPEEDSYDLIKKLGLDEETSKKSAEVRNQLIRDIIEEKITGSFADRFN